MNCWITSKILKYLSVEAESVTGIKISYYMETVLAELEKLAILISIFSVLGFFYDIVVIVGVMMMTRPYIGGTHKDSCVQCLLTTILFCGVSICIARYISLNFWWQMIVTILMIRTLWKMLPATSKYRPIYEGIILHGIRIKGSVMLVIINSIYVLLDSIIIRNEITILLYMLLVDVATARKNQIIEMKEGGRGNEKTNDKFHGKSIG